MAIKYRSRVVGYFMKQQKIIKKVRPPVTMAKHHDFLPRDIEGQAKNTFSAAPSLGFATLDQCKHWGPVNWSPVTKE